MIRWLVIGVSVVLPPFAMLLPAPLVIAKLDRALQERADAPRGLSRIILRTSDNAPAEDIIRRASGTSVRTLGHHVHVALVPDASLRYLAGLPEVLGISLDRAAASALLRSPPRLDSASRRSPGSAPRLGQQAPGAATQAGGPGMQGPPDLDGTGVGIATIDSGITSGHEDLAAARVVHWADFVNHLAVPYDDYGHGTHVAGVLAAAGAPALARRGMAPGASLVVLKALDGTGHGHVSDVIAAIDYAIDNRSRFNIRVINLSVAAGVYESYLTDPLTLAALRAVNAGLVVVAAAGNGGMSMFGEPQSGTIAAPGNAPWVLTVGASDDRGTPDRADDIVAPFSSRGPAAIDGTPKPDLVAPGVRIASTADAASTLFNLQPGAQRWSARAVSQPYLRLSGTSMAVPVVTGTVALMLQAGGALTPNAVKAILQFTAEPRPGHDDSSQGAGLVNPRGAVALARQFAVRPLAAATLESTAGGTRGWSRTILWGAQRVSGLTLDPDASAWNAGVVWGSETDPGGSPLTWASMCAPPSQDCGSPATRRNAGEGRR